MSFASVVGRTAIKDVLLQHVREQVENKCTIEGFVHPKTCEIISHSSGTASGANVRFDVVFECDVCSPSEGSMITCIAKNVTRAGIRAMIDSNVTPVVIYVARDHHFKDEYFESVEVGNTIRVKVIGQRFELNDKHVSIIGELIKPETIVAITAKKQHQQQPQHKRATAAAAAAAASSSSSSTANASGLEARNADIELIEMVRKNPKASDADIALANELELEHADYLLEEKIRKDPNYLKKLRMVE